MVRLKHPVSGFIINPSTQEGFSLDYKTIFFAVFSIPVFRGCISLAFALDLKLLKSFAYGLVRKYLGWWPLLSYQRQTIVVSDALGLKKDFAAVTRSRA